MDAVKKTQARYDAEADVLYLVSRRGRIARSHEVAPGITLEYNGKDEIVGIEVLHASRVLADNVIASLHAKQAGVL